MRAPDTLKLIVFIVLYFTSSTIIAADSAEDAYTRFHQASVAADLDEMLKYATEAQKVEMDALPEEQKKATIEFMARLTPKEMTILGQIPGASPDALTLYAEGMGLPLLGDKPEKMYATAEMTREAGEWRVGKSEWNSERPANLDQVTEFAEADTPSTPEAAEPAEPPTATAAPEPVEPAVPAASEPVAEVEEAPAPPAPPPVPKEPEKPKEQCIIKQVMTNAEIETCRRVAYGE